MRPIAIGASFAVLAAIPASPGSAQVRPDSARTDSTATRLKAVTVTAARATGTVGGTNAVIVRTDGLRASPAPLLEQALRESPFVHVRQNSRGEMELSVRGSDSRQAAVMLNGVPLTLGWDHRTDPSLIPITGTQRLVIVRGLGTLLNGPNTLGGTIEVAHADVEAGAPSGSNVWFGAGIDDNAATVTTLGGSKRIAGTMGGALSLEGGFAYRNRDGVALPEDATDPSAENGLRTNTDQKVVDGFASIRWGNATGRRIGLTFSGFDAERGVPPEEHISAPRLWRYPYHTRTVTAVSASTGVLSTPLGTASLEAGLGYNSGRLKIETFTDRTYTTVNGQELGDERTLTGRALLTHSIGNDAVFKASYTSADVKYEETLGTDPGATYQQKLWSLAAEVEAEVARFTTLSGGLVLDNSSTPETGGRLPTQEPFDKTGWRFGVMHEFAPELRLHASATQRSRFPALRELYSGALNRFMPNPELKPETLLGFEAGLLFSSTLGSSTNATFQATGFKHNLDDAVVRITLPAPDRRFRRINRDRIESSGAELLMGFVFGPDPSRAVSLTGDALLQKITIFDITADAEPSRHAENNPETRGTLELGVPLPLEVRAFANARYTGTQYCLNPDGDELTLDSQMESDIAVEKVFPLAGRLFRSLRALVAVDNVADATVFDQCGLPQPGRTLRFMLTVR